MRCPVPIMANVWVHRRGAHCRSDRGSHPRIGVCGARLSGYHRDRLRRCRIYRWSASTPTRTAAPRWERVRVRDVASIDLRRPEEGRLTAVTAVSAAGDLDVIDICVHTPLATHEASYLGIEAWATPGGGRAAGQLICSPVQYPGTTGGGTPSDSRTIGSRIGEDIFLAFAPKRLDPANRRFTLATPQVVGGVTQHRPISPASSFRPSSTWSCRSVMQPQPEMVKDLETPFGW